MLRGIHRQGGVFSQWVSWVLSFRLRDGGTGPAPVLSKVLRAITDHRARKNQIACLP